MIKRPISELPEEAERDTWILLEQPDILSGGTCWTLARFNGGDYEWHYDGTFLEVLPSKHAHFYYLAELEETPHD